MSKFRKRPVVIEAFQMTRERRQDNRDWPSWLHQAWNAEPLTVGSVSTESIIADRPSNGTDRLVVSTFEGSLTVEWNDWIIQGIAGELYPCKPDIFAATYEPVE